MPGNITCFGNKEGLKFLQIKCFVSKVNRDIMFVNFLQNNRSFDCFIATNHAQLRPVLCPHNNQMLFFEKVSSFTVVDKHWPNKFFLNDVNQRFFVVLKVKIFHS